MSPRCIIIRSELHYDNTNSPILRIAENARVSACGAVAELYRELWGLDAPELWGLDAPQIVDVFFSWDAHCISNSKWNWLVLLSA